MIEIINCGIGKRFKELMKFEASRREKQSMFPSSNVWGE